MIVQVLAIVFPANQANDVARDKQYLAMKSRSAALEVQYHCNLPIQITGTSNIINPHTDYE